MALFDTAVGVELRLARRAKEERFGRSGSGEGQVMERHSQLQHPAMDWGGRLPSQMPLEVCVAVGRSTRSCARPCQRVNK
ncbi:unnamed protein product [Boreogadus saida]